MSSGPTIRQARPGEELALHAAHMRSINEVCIKDHGPEETRGWGGRQPNDKWTKAIERGQAWVIEHEGQVRGVGYLGMVSAERARIFALYLTPEVIGQGLGARLARTLLDQARAAGAKEVLLESSITAHEFYRRLGFVDQGPMITQEIGGSLVRGYPMRLALD